MMPTQMMLYHGTTGDNVLSIIESGTIRPNFSGEICFSRLRDDAIQHGADTKRRLSFAAKMNVTIPDGVNYMFTSRKGNPLTVVIDSPQAIPVQVIELYIRQPRGTTLSTVIGVEAIKLHLR